MTLHRLPDLVVIQELIRSVDILASIVERLARGTSDNELARAIAIRAGELRRDAGV